MSRQQDAQKALIEARAAVDAAIAKLPSPHVAHAVYVEAIGVSLETLREALSESSVSEFDPNERVKMTPPTVMAYARRVVPVPARMRLAADELASSETQEERSFTCVVRRAGKTDPPQDCDWPFCGCDEHATKVIDMLQECGWGPNAPSPPQPAETPERFEDICPRCTQAFEVTGDHVVGSAFCPTCVRLLVAETPEERKDAQ